MVVWCCGALSVSNRRRSSCSSSLSTISFSTIICSIDLRNSPSGSFVSLTTATLSSSTRRPPPSLKLRLCCRFRCGGGVHCAQDATSCSRSLSWRSRPETLGVLAELSTTLISGSQ
ncbi:hypothetical protein ZIOFF_064255 [Zingiber officinale]|uniref:Uncharacterized protein n=1 Tax=Zingiber officinale TaxID=94328 RepID=A0A8J5KCH0_ZINOF|nr:hypothetical protein ZIOFF_064255 [Zingiber officinale]